jgi:hypothetical protein
MFVDAEPETVRPVVESVLGQRFEPPGYLTVSGVDVEVNANKDARGRVAEQWRAKGGAQFILWPALVELDTGEDEVTSVIVELTARLLTALWDDGQPAVAACDYEDQLPWSGGIARLDD